MIFHSIVFTDVYHVYQTAMSVQGQILAQLVNLVIIYKTQLLVQHAPHFMELDAPHVQFHRTANLANLAIIMTMETTAAFIVRHMVALVQLAIFRIVKVAI